MEEGAEGVMPSLDQVSKDALHWKHDEFGHPISWHSQDAHAFSRAWHV